MEAPECYYPPEKVEHFIVEDLLDFSNEAAGFPEGEGETFGNKAGHSTATSAVVVTTMDNCNSSSSYNSNFCLSFADTTLNDDFCVPYESKELEWLSNLEEEPFSTEDLQKLQLISGLTPSSSTSIAAGRSSQQTHLFLSENPVPGKARSKRPRATPRNWSSRLPILSPTAVSSPESVELTSRVAKLEGRKCLHCAAEKTPQWRTGPMGPKTLCNACGVRYKSGRLVPEYRPAASPTFVVSEHSNSHRKVLELRHQKERQQQFLGPGEVYNGRTEDDDGFLICHHVGPYDKNLF